MGAGANKVQAIAGRNCSGANFAFSGIVPDEHICSSEKRTSCRRPLLQMITGLDSWRDLAFRMLWVFTLCSVIGLAIEEVYHLIVFGEYQDRAGLVFGPFSPIYGVGGMCLLTIAKRIQALPLPGMFLVAAVSGGIVEYLTSLLLESAFGLQAWDYTGNWLSIGGRTSGYYLILWGLLGMICVKILLPLFESAVLPRLNRIPSIVSKALGAFIALDIAITMVAFGCWQEREAGVAPESYVQRVCAVAFDDDFMATRFETLSFARII